MSTVSSQEILYQIVAVGNAVKITAVDPETGTEVSVAAPRNTPLPSLKAAAVKKLAYVINKNKQ